MLLLHINEGLNVQLFLLTNSLNFNQYIDFSNFIMQPI